MRKKQFNELKILFEDILGNHSTHLENQKKYLNMIKSQKMKFIKDLRQAIESI